MKSARFARRVAATAWVVAVTAGSPATAAETTWKVAIWGQPRTATQPVDRFMKDVTARTGGQLKFEVTYGQSKPTEAADLLRSGAREAAYFCSSYFPDKMPLTTVLDLPMLAPETTAAIGKVELALAEHPAIRTELSKWNIKMLLPVPLPQYQLMGTRRIAKVEDFRNARVRISPETGRILEEYGATTRMITGGESVAALNNGSLDTISFAYPVGFATFKIHEASKYVTDKISLGTQLCYLGVGQRAWDALPAKVQAIVLSLREPAHAQYEELYARENAEFIAAFRRQGLEFVTFSPAERARLVAKAIKVWQAWVDEREKQGLKGREVFEFTQTKIREFTR